MVPGGAEAMKLAHATVGPPSPTALIKTVNSQERIQPAWPRQWLSGSWCMEGLW